MNSSSYPRKCFYNATYLRFAKSINLGITGPNPTRSTPLNPLSTAPKPNNAHLPKTPTPGRPPMQAGDVLVALSGGAGSLSMLDLLMENRFVGDPAGLNEAQGGRQQTGGGGAGTRVIKRFTWRFCYAVHVDFSDVLSKVGCWSGLKGTSWRANPVGFDSSLFRSTTKPLTSAPSSIRTIPPPQQIRPTSSPSSRSRSRTYMMIEYRVG
jgi:hypothetical protein